MILSRIKRKLDDGEVPAHEVSRLTRRCSRCGKGRTGSWVATEAWWARHREICRGRR